MKHFLLLGSYWGGLEQGLRPRAPPGTTQMQTQHVFLRPGRSLGHPFLRPLLVGATPGPSDLPRPGSNLRGWTHLAQAAPGICRLRFRRAPWARVTLGISQSPLGSHGVPWVLAPVVAVVSSILLVFINLLNPPRKCHPQGLTPFMSPVPAGTSSVFAELEEGTAFQAQGRSAVDVQVCNAGGGLCCRAAPSPAGRATGGAWPWKFPHCGLGQDEAAPSAFLDTGALGKGLGFQLQPGTACVASPVMLNCPFPSDVKLPLPQ